MRGLLLVLLLAAQGAAGAQFYKCTGPDGKVNFTDSPCAASEAVQTLDRVPPQGLDKVFKDIEDSKARRAENERVWAERERAEATRLYRRQAHAGLELGMTASQVRAHPVWGGPDEVNATRLPGLTREQWVYGVDPENEYERMYLYFDNGVLTTIQD